jgi:hypothetical protein
MVMRESTEMADPPVKESTTKFSLTPGRFRVLFLSLILLVSVLAILPFFYAGKESGLQRISMVATHDMNAHFAFMEQFDKVLRSGVYYPRWLPDINNGYGIATMNFYPPGFYYLTSLAHSLFNSWEKSLLVITLLSFIGSGLAFYLLAHQFYGRVASAIGTFFYLLLPYHTVDLYWRGAMPEFIGFVFLPLILYFTWKLGSEGRAIHYAGLGLFYGLHLITHFPVSYLFTYTLALYALLWAVRQRDWRVLLRIAGGMTLGLLLSAIYWLPAALEAKHTQEAVTEVFPYHLSLVTLTPGRNAFDSLINQVFTVQGLAIIVSFFALHITLLKFLYRQDSDFKPDAAQSQTRLWLILAFATTLMSTMFAIQIARLIPKIQATVPAWRWLAIASLFTSLLVSASVHYLGQGMALSRLQLWGYRAAIAVVLAANLWITVQYVILGGLQNPTFSPTKNFVEGGFTPKGATWPDRLPESQMVEFEPEGGEFEVKYWEPQRREIVVNLSRPSAVRLKTYNFPGWTARLDGQTSGISSDSGGVQVIMVPSGIHKLEIFFANTWPRTLGNLLSALSFFIMAGLAAFTLLQARNRRAASVEKELTAAAADAEEPGLAAGLGQILKSRTVIAAGILALLLLALFIIRPFRVEERSPSKTPNSPSGSLDNRLQIAGAGLIYVASDEKSLHDLMDALPRGKTDAVEDLLQSGKVMRVNNGTKVRILEQSSMIRKVKILEGDQIMKEGWVLESWIQ